MNVNIEIKAIGAQPGPCGWLVAQTPYIKLGAMSGFYEGERGAWLKNDQGESLLFLGSATGSALPDSREDSKIAWTDAAWARIEELQEKAQKTLSRQE